MSIDTPDWSAALPRVPSSYTLGTLVATEGGAFIDLGPGNPGELMIPLRIAYAGMPDGAWSSGSGGYGLRGMVWLQASGSVGSGVLIPEVAISPATPAIVLDFETTPVLAAAEQLRVFGYSQPGAGSQAVSVRLVYRVASS